MTTKRVETKVYTEHMYCECGGEMKQELTNIGEDGISIQTSVATWPPTYYLVCDKCRRRVSSHEVYPRIVYEEVEMTGINTAFGEWTPCRNCTYFEDCEDKESREGCYCGEKRGSRNER